MGRDIKIDLKGLEDLKKRLQKIEQEDATRFFEELSREIAARLLAKVIKRTPVGKTDGGTLRRGWTGGGEKGTAAKSFASGLDVKKSGKSYTVVISNNVEYASYVEYGHRIMGGIERKTDVGCAEGKFILTLSEHEIKGRAPKIIERKIAEWLASLGGA